MESFEVTTHSRTELKDITRQVQTAVTHTGAKTGICFIYVPHTTAGVTVNESYDPDVAGDINKILSRLVPASPHYAHAEGNADAHIKATIVGCCAQVPVENGRLVLGRWQGVFFCEFDGPRQRRVQIRIVGDSE
ncbi:hypothetical protein CH330_08255 [candidate division WOR-3 bacterium JGI_Cruoil_03_51_56]|uniref:Secondary thiamine-phosphate synthase enzyme n=1 Tax=candidate division WOR-3 bacterium JGI_Cruoil_03_51_56 TaxID=1973747 RepID=A0A235BRE3_UNCW3|nr:MAG: hypothetical protein CH330_08255 [candidate division WOR-3 bacterium JGI_Cruoil_03_51_56]